MKRKIKMGMVGGGPGAFIGSVHRMAARLDGKIDLVCGAFSSDRAKSLVTAAELFLPESRCYWNYQDMIEFERKLPVGERMDCVSIVTPNITHYDIALKALDNGFHVICEKPMTFTLEQARKLAEKVQETGTIFALTHNYTGYPMVKQARAMIKAGTLGEIRKIVAEYPQGWLGDAIEGASKQAEWRVDPARAGISCCMGDIGSHVENLTEYITGLKITELCADLTTFVPGHTLDDDGNVLVRFDNGARGVLYASQMSTGEENGLSIRVYGTKGAVEWHQESPETLVVKYNNKPMQVLRRNWAGIGAEAAAASRIPAGHPEGFIEAFANIYSQFADAVAGRLEGDKDFAPDFPTAEDGLRGMAFIDAVVKSSRSDQKWLNFEV
ncbi:MAG: Glucose-6-phosphate 3-dehydrogenase [Lentisphaerae bacterium ADurb.Bin242]|nr:MAG: Glucose-6-phosphate 3-dehydrogenase [Lentisphaerae bacterium ADurb.Bin242]